MKKNTQLSDQLVALAKLQQVYSEPKFILGKTKWSSWLKKPTAQYDGGNEPYTATDGMTVVDFRTLREAQDYVTHCDAKDNQGLYHVIRTQGCQTTHWFGKISDYEGVGAEVIEFIDAYTTRRKYTRLYKEYVDKFEWTKQVEKHEEIEESSTLKDYLLDYLLAGLV
jgi:hypothetical protein